MGLVVCSVALAQTAPTAGSLNQQIERELLPRPTKTTPDIRIEQGTTPVVPSTDEQKIAVAQVRIAGAQVYPEAVLLAVTGFSGPSELTLSDLRAMALKIGEHYRKHGYFLAQAYLPAQDIRDGAVTIAVLEGQYGQVSVRNNANVSDGLVKDLLDGLRSGDTVAITPLESRLLLLSDLAGVNVKSTLVPGASVGASDLIVDLVPEPLVTGNIDADNQGNRYTGADRLGAALYINNPSGYGDLVSVRALTSDAGMRYGRLAYQTHIGRARAGVAYSRMHYRLGQDFASLQASGVATVTSLYGSYPLLRSRSHNLTGQVNLDDKTFRDRADATLSLASKKARVAMLSLNGDARDTFGGSNTYSLTWSRGEIAIQSPAALASDAATVRSNGRYDTLSFSAMRLQNLSGSMSLYAAVSGQLASKNLDASEKMGLGGSSGVRAYPSGEAYGDRGYVLKLETRVLLPAWPGRLPGRMQWIGFVDTGSVTLNRNAWASGAKNRRTLSGAGIGLNWVGNGKFAASATVARKLGKATARSAPDTNSRFWLQVIKQF
jgi:hemolysin activation/secretion protein